MFDRHRISTRMAFVLAGCLGLAGTAAGAVSASSASAAPLRCEIATTAVDGMMNITGIVHANAAVAGSYQLRLVSAGASGSSDISQGGAFAAGPREPVTVGQVMLGADAGFDAELDLLIGGKKVSCNRHVNGAT